MLLFRALKMAFYASFVNLILYKYYGANMYSISIFRLFYKIFSPNNMGCPPFSIHF